MGYLTNFIVYVLATAGLIMFSLFVFKAASSHNGIKNPNGNSMRLIESLSLGVRKNLYIVEVEGERFLIAGDVDRTSLISKLGDKKVHNNSEVSVSPNGIHYKKTVVGMQKIASNTAEKRNVNYESVIKNLAEKIRG